MAEFTLLNAGILFGAVRVDSHANEVQLSPSAETPTNNTFGVGWMQRLGGLKTAAASAGGYFNSDNGDAADIDPGLFDLNGVNDTPFSVGPTVTEGDTAYTMQAAQGGLSLLGAIGEVAPFQLNVEQSRSPLVRGVWGAYRPAATASLTGPARQLGAVGATQRLYAALHVWAATGTSPTLDVVVRSDDNSGMTTPTTRITFSQKTGVTHDWQSVAGAIADDWFDVDVTIGGAGPSFGFAVVIGIA